MCSTLKGHEQNKKCMISIQTHTPNSQNIKTTKRWCSSSYNAMFCWENLNATLTLDTDQSMLADQSLLPHGNSSALQ